MTEKEESVLKLLQEKGMLNFSECEIFKEELRCLKAKGYVKCQELDQGMILYAELAEDTANARIERLTEENIRLQNEQMNSDRKIRPIHIISLVAGIVGTIVAIVALFLHE